MTKFRTIEVSDPRFEADNLRFITVKTPNLKGRGDICLFVPPKTQAMHNLPLVILLHGVYGSAWSWPMQGGLHLTALRMVEEGKIPPMLIAMPSDGLWGDGSAYLLHNGYDFEKWIVEDVPAAVQKALHLPNMNSPLFIGGLSMGGFGALHLGAKYENRFRAISAHSAITHIRQMELFVEEGLGNYKQHDPIDEDVFECILKNKSKLPALRFDCGKDDLLIEHNRRLHQQLDEAGIAHGYAEYPGGHEWAYWGNQVEQSLLFFADRV